MSRRKATQNDPISDDRLRAFLEDLDRAEEAVTFEREGVKDVMDTIKGTGLSAKAVKSALKLSKRPAAEQNDWLATFHRCCELLGVGQQHEMFERDGDNIVNLPR